MLDARNLLGLVTALPGLLACTGSITGIGADRAEIDALQAGVIDAHSSTADAAPGDAPLSLADAVGAPSPRRQVLELLDRLSGEHTVAGQHNREPNSEPRRWTDAIYATTGRYPGLWSGDFLFQQDNIDARWTMIDEAVAQWQSGAIVNLMWHACPPTQGEPCAWDGGILSHLTDDQWQDLTSPDGALHAVWLQRLDEIAIYLRHLEDRGVAVLFRPLHEMNQGAFWWGGRPGPDGTRKLFQITHDYLVDEQGLSNLVWTWDVQDLSWDFDAYDPGAGYWDVVALDVYGDGFTTQKYDAVRSLAGDKPMAIGECARLPTPAEIAAQPRWVFFMGWAELVYSENSESEIDDLYADARVSTLGELDGWQ